jgi:hypothetical protein
MWGIPLFWMRFFQGIDRGQPLDEPNPGGRGVRQVQIASPDGQKKSFIGMESPHPCGAITKNAP